MKPESAPQLMGRGLAGSLSLQHHCPTAPSTLEANKRIPSSAEEGDLRIYIMYKEYVVTSQKSSGTEETGRRRDCRSSPSRVKLFHIQISCKRTLGPKQTRIQWVQETIFLWIKWPERKVDHSLPIRTEVKKKTKSS
jgi:hypothetical protein